MVFCGISLWTVTTTLQRDGILWFERAEQGALMRVHWQAWLMCCVHVHTTDLCVCDITLCLCLCMRLCGRICGWVGGWMFRVYMYITAVVFKN